MKVSRLLWGAAVASALIGCGGEEASNTFTGAAGGCMQQGAICLDHPETMQTQQSLQLQCEASGHTFHPNGCPADGRVARCTAEHASGSTTTHYYEPAERESIEEACTAAGHLYTGG